MYTSTTQAIDLQRLPKLGILLLLALGLVTAGVSQAELLCDRDAVFTEGDTYELLGGSQIFLALPSAYKHVDVQKRSDSSSQSASSPDFTWNSANHHRKGSVFLAATRGELDTTSAGDEVALAFFDAQSRLQLITMTAPADANSTWNSDSYDPSTYFAWDQSSRKPGPVAIATGDLDQASKSQSDEIVIAYFDDSELRVKVVSAAMPLNPNSPDPTLASWENTEHHRDHGSEVAVAVGRLAPDQPPKVLVGIVDGEQRVQVIVLDYSNGTLSEETYISGQHPVETEAMIFGAFVGFDDRDATLRGSFDMVLANLEGGPSKEIAVVFRSEETQQSIISNLAYDPADNGPGSLRWAEFTMIGTGVDRNYLAAGDVDGDGLDELALLNTLSSVTSSSLVVSVLEPGISGLGIAAQSTWQDSESNQTWWPQDIAVADINLDGFSEIVISLTQMRSVRVNDDYQSAQVEAFETRVLNSSGGSVVEVESWSEPVDRDNSALFGKDTQLDGMTSLALADADNRNYYGKATGERHCQNSAQIRALIQNPPSWANPPGGTTAFGTKKGGSITNSTSSTTSYGGNLTFSLGFSIPMAFQIGGSVSASIQHAATRSLAQQVQFVESNSYSIPSNGLKVTGYNSLVLQDTVSYDCYEFDAYQGGSPLMVTGPSGVEHPGSLQSCLPYQVETAATDLGTWTESRDQLENWVPLMRQWTRPNLSESAVSVSQSNVPGGATSPCDPRVAVNGLPDSTPCFNEPSAPGEAAWWQADLGSSQAISSLVFFTEEPLYNFWVYIGDDAGAMPPAQSQTPNGTWNSDVPLTNTGWTFIPTTAPLAFELALSGQGQYVRILDAQGAQLGLKELQILGLAEVDTHGRAIPPTPDQFPNSLEEMGEAGWFEMSWDSPSSSRPVLGQLWTKDRHDTGVGCNSAPAQRAISFVEGTTASSGTQIGENVAVGGSLKVLNVGLAATGTYGFQQGDTIAYGETTSLAITVQAAGVETNELPFHYQPFVFFRPIVSTAGEVHLVLETDHLVTEIGTSACKVPGS